MTDWWVPVGERPHGLSTLFPGCRTPFPRRVGLLGAWTQIPNKTDFPVKGKEETRDSRGRHFTPVGERTTGGPNDLLVYPDKMFFHKTILRYRLHS